MQKQNVEEYAGLRSELGALKSCITTYVGFVAAGSATAFWGLAGKFTSAEAERTAMALAAVLLAVVSTFVLLLLSYKFSSHNRYAGYSKLLTHERFGETRIDVPIVCWEICVDRVRESDRDHAAVLRYCEAAGRAIAGATNLRAEVERVSGPAPVANRRAAWRGLAILLGISREHSASWHFPVYVGRIFAAINGLFLMFALLLIRSRLETLDWTLATIVSCVGLLILLWIGFAIDMCRLMVGSETVEAYCWKFVPIRCQFLVDLDPHLKYQLVGVAGAAKKIPSLGKPE